MGLRGESARPLVKKLAASGTPFAVVTAADQARLKTEFPGLLVIMKPLGVKALEEAARTLLARVSASTR